MARKIEFFLAIAETPPNLGAAKIVQVERNGKKKIIFLAIAETPPNFGAAKIVQVERNGKKN